MSNRKVCKWCSNDCDDAYHPECWRNMHDARNREECALMREAHEAIAARNKGQRVTVSGKCRERYGKFVDGPKQQANERKRRDVGSV